MRVSSTDVRRAAFAALLAVTYAGYLAARYWYERVRGREHTIAALILNGAGERRSELIRQELMTDGHSVGPNS